MTWTIYFNNHELHARSQPDVDMTLSLMLEQRPRWTGQWATPLDNVRAETRVYEVYDSRKKLVRKALVVKDVRSGSDSQTAPEYDAFVFLAGTERSREIIEHRIVEDPEESVEMFDGKDNWIYLLHYNCTNGVWVLRVLSKYDGRQVSTAVMIPRHKVVAKRKRIIPRQHAPAVEAPIEVAPEEPAPVEHTRDELEAMDLPAVRKIAADKGIELKPRTRKYTFIDAILGETKQLPEVEVSPVTIGYDPSPQLAGALIKGGWDEAQRMMAMSDLSEVERDADGDIIGEIWAYDFDGNVDVTLEDGSVVHIDA